MKKDYTTFICDNCQKEATKLKNTGFPYEEGWCYIYNFSSNFLKLYAPGIDLDVGHIQLKDKHFCCEDCMKKYIEKSIEEAKIIKSEPISAEEIEEFAEEMKK